jgi:uncharacterized protein YbbC (DUF1343 family)
VEIILTDMKTYRPVETSLHIIDAYRKTNPDSLTWTPPYPLDELWNEDTGIEQILLKSQEETTEYFELRKKYLLYR